MMVAALLALAIQDPEIRVLASHTSARPGDSLHVAVEFAVPPGWHLYGPQEATGIPTSVRPVENPHVEFGEPLFPEARKETEGVLADSWVFDGTVHVFLPLRVRPTAPAGELELSFEIAYMMCTDETCLFPVERTVSGKLPIGPGDPAPANAEVFARLSRAAPPPTTAQSSASEEYESKGLLWLLTSSLLGGLVTLIMPCVYPMIPITLNYFVKQAGGSRRRGLGLAAVYALGIVVSFSAIGFLLSILIGPDGARRFAANPWVNLAVAAMFLAFALSFFGLFEIALPASITNRLAGGGPRRGIGGAFVLGALFSVVTFTCTVPVAGGILALAAGSAHRWAAALAMVVYSGTMAAPFLLLGLFPGLVGAVPKGGGWFTLVKGSVGILELGLALMYVANADQTWVWGVLTRRVMVVAWIVVAAAMAVFLLVGAARFVKAASARAACGVLALLLLGVGGAFARGLDGVTSLGPLDIVLPPAKWDAFGTLPEALAAARERGKPVFVEFTGVT